MLESTFLSWIASQANPAASHLPIGDDMAGVFLTPHQLALLKIDQVLDGVHFDLTTTTPEAVGRKAVNRCLSDCAAAAATPIGLLLSVALPNSATDALAQALYQGCQAAGNAFNCPIVGGDTAIWPGKLALTVAAIARTDHTPVTRAGAQPGDAICVSGSLGGSILGRHLTFTPRIHLAQTLTRHATIHAMMDLSDGLAIDLPRLCARSQVGATIDLALLPIHPDAHTLASHDYTPAATHALTDGEDYELLFALTPDHLKTLQNLPIDPPITRIGTVTQDPQLILIDENGTPQPWPQGGWNHGQSTPKPVF